MGRDIAIALIGAGSVLAGTGISMVGQIMANKIEHKRNLLRIDKEHKRRIDYLVEETFFKKKIEYIQNLSKKLHDTLESFKKIVEEFDEGKIIEPGYLLGEISFIEYLTIFESIKLHDKIDKFRVEEKKFVSQVTKILDNWKDESKRRKGINNLGSLHKKAIQAGYYLSEEMRNELRLK